MLKRHVLRTGIAALAVWAAGIAAPGVAADELADKVAALEKRVKELEAQTVLSLPEMIVKEKKTFVCPKGHSFDKAQAGNVCPFDGTGLSVQATYQREKYYRRKSIEEKIEESLSTINPVNLGVSLTGLAFQTLGTGKPRNNSFFGSGSGDVFLSAKPAYQTLVFIDLEFNADTGVKSRVPTLTSLVSDDARLNENEEVNLREAWISSVLGSRREWTVSAGSMDLTGLFDQNRYANDETRQFTSDIFVNNFFLGAPANGAAAAVVYDPKGAYALKIAIQRPTAGNSNLGSRMFSIAEIDVRARPWQGWEGGTYRFWLRSNGEADRRENIATGASFDQDITRAVSFFGRYGSRRTQSALDGNGKPVFPARNDIHYTLGVEFRGPRWTWLPRDVWGVAFGRTEVRSIKGQEFSNGGVGETESLMEGYYKIFVTDHLHFTPFVQWLADSVRAETNSADDLILGLRTQMDF